MTSYYVQVPPAGSPDVVVERGVSTSIDPGTYGDIEVASGAQLQMRAGVYAVRRLAVRPGAIVHVIGEPAGVTMLSVVDEALLHSAIGGQPGGQRVLLSLLGGGDLEVRTPWNGWIVAPRASLTLPAELHRGAFVARDLVVRPGGVIEHDPIDWAIVRTSRAACALEPRVTCVRAADLASA